MFLEKLCFGKVGKALVECCAGAQNLTRVGFDKLNCFLANKAGSNNPVAPPFIEETGYERQLQKDNSGKIALAVVGGVAGGIIILWICCHHGSTIIKQAGKLVSTIYNWWPGAWPNGEEDAPPLSSNTNDEAGEGRFDQGRSQDYPLPPHCRPLGSAPATLSPSEAVQSPYESPPPKYEDSSPLLTACETPPPEYHQVVCDYQCTGEVL